MVKLQKMKEEIREELVGHILPFWMKLKDEENGGFYGLVHYDLSVDKLADKGAILAARLLWSFSAAYRVTGNSEYLDYAHHAYRFLIDKIYDHEYGGLYWMVDYRGRPVDDRKHVYSQSFGIYALSEYYIVTGAQEALDYAVRLYRLIETKGFHHERNAYKEEFSRHWKVVPNEKLSENGLLAEITTNTHLHILEAYTNLYRVWPEEEVKDRLINLLGIFYHRIFQKETKFLKVFFDKDWNSLTDLKSYGHDIEASWLMDDALKVLHLEKEEYKQMVIDIAYNISDHAVLQDGSLANEKEGDRTDVTRVWWVQAEAAVGFLNAYERTKDEKFLVLTKNLWEYIKNHLIDQRQNGEWFWSVEADGKPEQRPVVDPWKCPYHNSRFCLQVMERVGEG